MLLLVVVALISVVAVFAVLTAILVVIMKLETRTPTVHARNGRFLARPQRVQDIHKPYTFSHTVLFANHRDQNKSCDACRYCFMHADCVLIA